MSDTPTTLWVVYDVAKRRHWPVNDSYYDEDGAYVHGSDQGISDDYELVVHVGASPDQCRSEMNEYFTRANKTDYRMTCRFGDGQLQSSTSGNYNGGGYMRAYHHFEIRPAPSIKQRPW